MNSCPRTVIGPKKSIRHGHFSKIPKYARRERMAVACCIVLCIGSLPIVSMVSNDACSTIRLVGADHASSWRRSGAAAMVTLRGGGWDDGTGLRECTFGESKGLSRGDASHVSSKTRVGHHTSFRIEVSMIGGLFAGPKYPSPFISHISNAKDTHLGWRIQNRMLYMLKIWRMSLSDVT